MKKDKEWLINEVLKLRNISSRVMLVTIGEVMELIYQLDEPEKVVIPQFVADWYEQEGSRMNWWNWFYKWGGDQGDSRTELEKRALEWMQDFNEGLFVDIFRYGYEIEKEPLYIVSSDEMASGFWFLARGANGKVSVGTNMDYFNDDGDDIKLTEQEIKDYDERYWAFAELVEETE